MGFLQLLLKAISPELRELIVNFILSLSKEAPKTDNPLDVILVRLLIDSFAIDYDKVDKK